MAGLALSLAPAISSRNSSGMGNWMVDAFSSGQQWHIYLPKKEFPEIRTGA